MTTEKTVKTEAADPKRGMTLDELDAFVHEAKRQGVPGDTIVRTTSTWRSTIKRAEVQGAATETTEQIHHPIEEAH